MVDNDWTDAYSINKKLTLTRCFMRFSCFLMVLCAYLSAGIMIFSSSEEMRRSVHYVKRLTTH